MKKVQLIEFGILAVALVCGFQFIQEFISFFVTSLFYFAIGIEDSIPRIAISSFLTVIIYLLSFLFLVSKSNWIARQIQKKNKDDDPVLIKIHGKDLLYIILVSICLFVIIIEIPGVLIYIYETVKIRLGSKAFYDSSLNRDSITSEFMNSGLKILMALIVLYYSGKIAGYFARKLKNGDAVVETKGPAGR